MEFEKRIAKLNTYICEQVFAWLCNFAPILNEMRPGRHLFCLLTIAKRHNDAIQKWTANYLHPTRRPMAPKIKPYGCSPKALSQWRDESYEGHAGYEGHEGHEGHEVSEGDREVKGHLI